jgi:hypothetical protein
MSVLLLSGCGAFELGTVIPVSGQSVAQRDNDMAVCKVKAYEASNSKERQAGNFIAGLTIIGAPIAIEDDKRLQRKIFKDCMEAKGYAIESSSENKLPKIDNNASVTLNTKQSAADPKSEEVARIKINIGDEWVNSEITSELKSAGTIFYKINHSIDAGFLVSRVSSRHIKEPLKYVETTKSSLESRLKSARRSETEIVEINGAQFAKYEISGALISNASIEVKYLSYVVVDKEDIFVVRFWTQVHHYDFQKGVFEQKMSNISVRDPQIVFSHDKRAGGRLTASEIGQQCKNLGFLAGSNEYLDCLIEIQRREK